MIKFRENEEYGDSLNRYFYEENNKFTRNITFQITDDCNLCCSYCYQHNKGHHKMPFEVAKKLIDKILTNDKSINSYVKSENAIGIALEFIGGEPFLEVDLIDKIIDYFIEKCIILHHPWVDRFRVSICSNGVLYFTPKV